MSKADNFSKLLNQTNKITISALDHRSLLKKMLHPENPEITEDQEIVAWKAKMVNLYKNEVSGLLIDPTYGFDLVDLTAKCGWIFSMEQTGYEGGEQDRITRLIPDWSVAKLKERGACAAKLLLYYDPENKALAARQIETAKKVAQECLDKDIVFLLEPLSYKKSNDPYLVEHIVDDLIDLPVDIFKIEYPGDGERCKRITNKLSVPWVLLSAGVEYDTYLKQLKTACENGASGMAVGRAAWQEFGQYQGQEREKYLVEVALPRIRELTKTVESCGKAVEI